MTKKYTAEFKESAVKLAHESGLPIAQTARNLGINENTLHTWIYNSRTVENGAKMGDFQSHKNGRIKLNQLLKPVENSQPVECIAEAGDILLMNPLLLHSSRKAMKASHRRIIHLEYCALDLPPPP